MDTALFSPARRSRALRDSWHVSNRRPALLYVGRVSKEKQLLTLPAVQDRLHALGVEHRFVFAGGGPLLPAAAEADARCGVHWAAVARSGRHGVRVGRLFVFPSRTDTAGNVVLEAQASGLPVVISGTGGPRENMVAGRTGTVCHLEDPDEWSSAIASVLRDPARHAEMRVAARQYALTRTWELAMQPLYRTYLDAYMRGAAATPSDAVHAPAHGI